MIPLNDKQVRNRIYILIGFLCVVLCAFLLRLVQWQLIDGDEYLSHAESTSTYSFSATAARGEIVDCYGRSLATNETVYQIELNQLMMGDTDLNEIIRQLIEILEASGEEWNDTMLISEPDENGHYEFTNEPGNESQEARLAALKDSLGKQQYGTADQVMAVLVEKYGLEDYEPLWQRRIAGVRYQMTLEEFSVRNNFVFATDIGSVTMATIKERSMNLPGVQVIGTSRRNYPDGTILPHILGSVGAITAEQWRVEDEDGNVSYPLRDAGYNMNDLIGQSGLEKVYEEELRGTDGTTEIVVGDGEIQEIRTGVTPTPGKTVMLTINREFQKRVDEALERNILTLQQTKAENAGKECNAGAVVVIDVDTGGLLAVSNYPSYDLNLYRSNYSDYANDPALPLINRAFTGQYAPGSAYKPSVALTGLLNGIVSPSDIIECNGTYTYYAPSYTPRCQHYHPGNKVDLYTALQHSCNVYFYDVGRRAGLAACADMANRLGLGVATGVEVGESLGHLTSTEDENYTVGLDVQSAIGQGNNAFTPVQLATYAATIANGGTRYKTHLVSGLMDTNTGEVIETVEPVVEDQIEDNIGAFEAVKDGMVLMAQGNSTLRNYPLTIAAKTGSPQRSEVYKVVNGTRYYYCNGVMIGFCPAEDPEIAVAIVLEYGGSGSNASQLMVDVLNAYYFDRTSSFEPDPEGELLS